MIVGFSARSQPNPAMPRRSGRRPGLQIQGRSHGGARGEASPPAGQHLRPMLQSRAPFRSAHSGTASLGSASKRSRSAPDRHKNRRPFARPTSVSPPSTVSIRRPCRGGIRPGVAKGPEPGVPGGDRGEGIEKVTGRAGQPVEPLHHKHVATSELVEHPAELAAIGLGPAPHLAEHLPASGLGELPRLRLNAPAVGRRLGHGRRS